MNARGWDLRTFETSLDGIVITGPDATVLRANPAACRILGCSEDELRRLGPALVRDETALHAVMDQFANTGRAEGELPVMRPDGSTIQVHFTSSLLPPEPGDDGPLACNIFRDVTAMRAAEARLKVLSDASRAFVERAHDERALLEALAERVVDAVGDCCVVRLVEHATGGLPIAAVHARDPSLVDAIREVERTHPLRADPDRPDIARLLRGELVRLPEGSPRSARDDAVLARWPLSDRFPVASALLMPMCVRGHVLGGIGITRLRAHAAPFHDDDVRLAQDLADRAALAVHNARLFARAESELAERRRAESESARLNAALIQAQKMEGLGRLAGGVAHDFNNLLSVILGCTRFALEALKEGDPLRADLLDVLQAGERAATLTRQLLAFSRAQALKVEAVDVSRVVADLERMLRRLIGEDVALSLVLAPGLGTVMADVGRLEQVLVNLVVNARDAMPSGGTLTIATAEEKLDAARAAALRAPAPGRYVRLSVADTGIGMDEATRARMFEPFFTTKGPGKGTGLGLSTVYGIVTQSNGALDVESRLGAGATFHLFFPVCDSRVDAARSERAPEPPRAAGEKWTVLIVDDDDAVRRVARRILEHAGFVVLDTGNPEAAVALCKDQGDAIDVLVSDVVMPRMSGPELVRRAKEHCRRARVILMSGYTADAIERYGTMDADLVLLDKPFTAEVLVACVREAAASAPRNALRADASKLR